jgi:phospholipase C
MRFATTALMIAIASVQPAFSASPRTDRGIRARIEHIVVVMMENRSFDHLLGWHPTADGIQAGLAYTDLSGNTLSTHPLAPDYMGCESPDPDHSYAGSRTSYDDGAMDGFLRAGDNDEYAIGYYVEEDRPFLAALARNYTTADRYFGSILSETFPNRFFLHAAQTDRLDNSFDTSTLPTIWDRLADAGVSGRYYYSDLSFLSLWGGKYDGISAPYTQFLSDAAAGKLPAVSFVDPSFLVEEIGTCNSDHPHCDIRAGDAFLAEAFHAVASGPDWAGTIFIVIYDEGGGFFDHVAPPRATAPNDVDPDVVDGKALLGFRVPAIIASPWSKGAADRPRVNSTVFDHTSVLKLIEWRWHLRRLTARDASDDVGNLVDALAFGRFDPTVPDLPMPPAPGITPCPTPASLARAEPLPPSAPRGSPRSSSRTAASLGSATRGPTGRPR